MPINYNRMAGIATKLLSPPPKGSGMAIALRRIVPGTYNPETQTVSGGSTVDYPTIGLWQTRSEDYQITGRGIGGVVKVSDVLSQDRGMVIDGSVEPQLTDKIIVDGEAWQILSIVVIKPTTVPIAYRLVTRK